VSGGSDAWTRTGTVLSPKNAGDQVHTGTGKLTVGGTSAAPNIEIKADGGIVANTDGLVYDAATKRLALGSSTANKLLQVGDRLGATNGCIEIANANGSDPNDYTFLQFAQSGNTDAISLSTYRYVSGGSWYNDLRFNTDGTAKMTLTAGGSLGIGTAVPGSLLHLSANSGNAILTIADPANGMTGRIAADPTTLSIGTTTSHRINFFTNVIEKASLTSDGKFLVGTSSAVGSYGLQVEQNSGSDPFAGSILLRRGLSNASMAGAGYTLGAISAGSQTNVGGSILFETDAAWGSGDYPTRLVFSTTPDGAAAPVERMRISQNGTIKTYVQTSSATTECLACTSDWGVSGRTQFRVLSNGNVENINNAYGAISDIKLKENIVDASSQWDDLKALQVRKYNFKEGQTHTQIGLIAQEVELVSPGLVSESPDRDEEGNDLGTVTKSVNYSVLYMKAVKALQEAMERIETLEAKVAALESA
jgi:hypothetical protein